MDIAPDPASARPIAVMIHGAGGGGWEYRVWKPVFEKAGYLVIAPDLIPATGGLAETTIEDYVRQVEDSVTRAPDVLIGASLGGVLVMKAAVRMNPKALILVASAIPLGVAPLSAIQAHPTVVHWAQRPFQETVDSMPDCDEEARQYAFPRWRDESGAVLDSLSRGVPVEKPACKALCVIPENDDTVPPEHQLALAKWARAETHRYAGMSHVGPLLSTRAAEVAMHAVAWLQKEFGQ